MSRTARSVLSMILLLAGACVPPPPSEVPDTPAGGPPPPRAAAPGAPGAANGRPMLVGEMCPSAAAGRPAVRPMFRRAAAWTERAADVAAAVERREARQFSVLGWDGRRAGLFSVAGAATARGGVLAIGGYAGRSPCEKPRGADTPGQRDPDCAAALRDCGLAVAAVEPAGGFAARPVEEDPEPVELRVGGVCLSGGNVLVDIDGDGEREAFPAAAFVDASGRPAPEVGAVEETAACEPRFAVRAGAIDILGVADLDADGRHELVVATGGGHPTWALYAATATAARLDRVAVAPAWPVR